jgi:chromosome segregation ATPase
MKKEDFKELLTDLYLAYNPDYIQYIPQLVEKYHRQEFSAVEMVLLKYNHESYAHYDPSKATDEYVHQLIADYSEGNRSLKGFTLEMEVMRKREAEANKSEEQKLIEAKIEAKAKEEAEKELSEVKGKLSETEKKIEEAQKELDKRLEQINKQLEDTEPIVQKTSLYDDIEIKIQSNYTESELELPNKEVLAGLGKGTRLLVNDKSGRMIGLVIEEILYDCVSHPLGTPIIDIIINKG